MKKKQADGLKKSISLFKKENPLRWELRIDYESSSFILSP